MKKFVVVFGIFFCFQLSANSQTPSLSDFNRLIDYLEPNYPDLLTPSVVTAQIDTAGSTWFYRDYGYLSDVPGGSGVLVAVNVSGGEGLTAGDVYAIGGAIGTDVVRIESLVNLLATVPDPGVGKLLIRAWDTAGVEMNGDSFAGYINYETGNWQMGDNQAVFPMGELPATKQSGSGVYPQHTDDMSNFTVAVPSGQYFVSDVPASTPFYFTALWRADNIGTVYMRADNAGEGMTVAKDGSTYIEIPYEFSVSEYQQLQRQLVGFTPTAELQDSIDLADQAMQHAQSTTDPAERALASYEALSLIMPLKEQVVVAVSNEAIAETGLRSDFDLNYEGFGSWTDAVRFRGNYEKARDAGFASVYTHGQLMTLIPEPGVYDFSTLESFISGAEDLGLTFGMAINTYLKGYPDWVQTLEFEELKTLFYEISFNVVSKFGDRVSWYYSVSEFELEANELSKQQLTELAIQSLAGARAAAPDIPMGYYASAAAYVPYQMNNTADAESPGFYSSLDLLSYMLANGVELDFMALQMQYGTTFAPIDIQRFQEVIISYHDQLNLPIYMGETGFSSKTDDYAISADFSWHGGNTQQAQYEWADHTLRALYALPFVKGYYWVHLDPDNFDYGSDYLSSLIGTGLLDVNGTPKKALSAFSDFIDEMSQ